MSESSFARAFRSKVLGHWVRFENSVAPGTPDTCYLAPDGSVHWIEFKNLPEWRPLFDTNPQQRLWMQKWCEHGGNAWVVALVRSELVVVQGWKIWNHRDNNFSLDMWLAYSHHWRWPGEVSWHMVNHLFTNAKAVVWPHMWD